MKGLFIVIVLGICTCSYLRSWFPNFVNTRRKGFLGMIRQGAVIGKNNLGDNLSIIISASCLILIVINLGFR